MQTTSSATKAKNVAIVCPSIRVQQVILQSNNVLTPILTNAFLEHLKHTLLESMMIIKHICIIFSIQTGISFPEECLTDVTTLKEEEVMLKV